MNLAPLKYLLFVENLACIFRNIQRFKTCTRVFVFCWTVTEIISVVAHVVDYLQKENMFQIKASRIYYISMSCFSVYVMLTSLYYSKLFDELLCNFDTFYNIFDDAIFTRTMKKAQKKLTALIVLFCFIRVFINGVVKLISRGDEDQTGTISLIISNYNVATLDIRYIFQYFILYCIFFVISEQLKVVTRSIESEMPAVTSNGAKLEHEEESVNIIMDQKRLEKIDKWMLAYKNIDNSSHLCKTMFSVQLTIMILIVTAYYIILLYSITLVTVEGISKPGTMTMNLFSMAVFLMALFVISRVGQMVQNSGVVLRQRLCELCVYSLENEQYYKLAKDMLRCVRTRPVRVHVFGSVDVNMSLLPSVVALFTSYTVIALQFNNVL